MSAVSKKTSERIGVNSFGRKMRSGNIARTVGIGTYCTYSIHVQIQRDDNIPVPSPEILARSRLLRYLLLPVPTGQSEVAYCNSRMQDDALCFHTILGLRASYNIGSFPTRLNSVVLTEFSSYLAFVLERGQNPTEAK
jgi:hypothetical protein